MIRPATPADAAPLAEIWHDAWHDAHDGHVPEGLAAARTPESFRQRVDALLPHAIVAESGGELAGFATVAGDEVELLFVAARSRGTGLAGRLLAAAEDRIGGTPWLCVVTGNSRARRFYERQGYVDVADAPEQVTVAGATYIVPSRRYVKTVRR